MTFAEMAMSLAPGASAEQINLMTLAMENAYCAALRSCSWKLHGIHYLYEGAHQNAQ